MRILITNDDGYQAKGLKVLVEIMKQFGEVTVIAPKKHQSGMSMAVSLGFKQIAHKDLGDGWHYVDATPASCVKFGLNTLFLDNYPDVVVSGINHGSNASIASLYSGTLGAAAEGAIYGVKSVGLSINTHHPDPDFTQIEPHLRKIIANAMDQELPQGVYLNVNFPAIPAGEIKGIKIAKQGNGMWHKEFEQRKDPYGRHYYWMTGNFKDLEQNPENNGDHNLMDQGYITIVPHKIDTTCYATMEQLENGWEL